MFLQFDSEDQRNEMKVSYIDECVEITVVNKKSGALEACFYLNDIEYEVFKIFIAKQIELRKC